MSQELPKGWAASALGEIALPTRPRVQPTDFSDLPFIGMEHIEAHTMRLLGTLPAWEMKSSSVHVQPGDLLYGRLRPYLNKVYVTQAEALCSAEFIVLPGDTPINSSWLSYLLNSGQFVFFASHLPTGDRPRVDYEQIAAYQLLLPPRREQDRIVAEIEKQLTRLDAAVEALKRVQANLKRYRGSVLKAACEGRLVPTEAELARKEGRPYEAADQLLARILQERRTKWEADQLAKMKASGKPPKDDSWKWRYKEPRPPDSTNLPSLPEGWTWASVDQALFIIDYRGRTPPFSDHGIPHLRSSNIRNGRVIWEGLTFVTQETFDQYMTRGLPCLGDLLFTTEAPFGEVAEAPTDRIFSLAQRLMILRPVSDLIFSKFLIYQIMNPEFQSAIRLSQTGSTVDGISSRNFKPALLRIPPVDEQIRIANEVDRLLSATDSSGEALRASFHGAERLRHSILKRAFEGKLVPQDPNDEPASVLLERIRAERAAKPQKAPKPRRRPAKVLEATATE